MSCNDGESWSETEQRILDARSRSLAEPNTARGTTHAVDTIWFTVAGELYAIEASFVQAVIALPPLALLPHAPPEVAGLASRAGLVFPVFHLCAGLDVPQAAQAAQAAPGRVILVGTTGYELGLIVETVVAVRPMEMEALGSPPSDLGTGARAIARGVGPEGVLVLDAAVLLASERLYVDIPIPPAMRQT